MHRITNVQTQVHGLESLDGLAAAGTVRVGTDDRQRAVSLLQAHYVAGRLSAEELEQRAEQAFAARTFGDLQTLLADLPPLADAASATASEEPDLGYRSRKCRKGRRHAERGAEIGMRAHVTSYAAVMVLLMTIWLLTTQGGYFWPVWPMLGWGIGLASHALAYRGTRRRDGLAGSGLAA